MINDANDTGDKTGSSRCAPEAASASSPSATIPIARRFAVNRNWAEIVEVLGETAKYILTPGWSLGSKSPPPRKRSKADYAAIGCTREQAAAVSAAIISARELADAVEIRANDETRKIRAWREEMIAEILAQGIVSPKDRDAEGGSTAKRQEPDGEADAPKE